MSEIKLWTTDNNLAFNKTKTKVFLFSGSRLSRYHYLYKNELIKNASICDKIEELKARNYWQLNLINFFKIEEHFTNVIKQCVLSSRKIKNLAPYKLGKLAESLVLNRLDYGNPLFRNVPEYSIKRIQKVQNRAASRVLGQ